MRFSLALPTDRVDMPDEFLTAAAIAEVARAAEAAGFDAVFVSDHPMPDRTWLASGGHHTLDPFVVLTVAACATTTLRVQTNLAVAGYRNPFVLAKATASLDVVSGGRMVLGMGAGYLEAEFDALGADFEGRNDRFDEALVAMKQAWSGEPVHVEGAGFRVADGLALPAPVQRPHPPLWIGGNSTRAMRRVAEHGDGWVPARLNAATAAAVRTAPMTTPADLAPRIERLRALTEEQGRPIMPEVMSMPMGGVYGRAAVTAAAVIEDAAQQAEIGVTGLAVTFEPPGRPAITSRRELLDLIAGFGAEVVSTVTSGGF